MQRSHCLRCLFIVVFSFCLLSCSWSETRRLFSTSERIMTERPDSALNILLDVNPDDLHTRKQRAKHALLLSMALDKNYIDIADDSIISIAYNYYLNHPTKREKMLSFYYSGVVKQNAGNYISAAIDFDQALTIAIALKDDHNSGMACKHLSTIYDYSYNHKKALDYSRMAVDYFEACGELLSADYAKANVAQQLSRELKWEDSIKTIDEVLSRTSFKPLIREALAIKTDALLWGREDYAGALSCLDLIPIGKQQSDTLVYYGYKGLLSEALGNTKDADKYFSLAERYMKSPTDSLTLLDQRSYSYQMRHDYVNAYSDLRNVSNILNKQVTELLGQSVTGAMEQWYRESYNTQKERTRQNTIIYSILGVLLLLIILGLILFVRKLHIDRLQDMDDIESLNNDLQVLKERNEHFRKASNAVIMDKVQFLHQLSDSYFSWTDDAVKKREEEKGVQTKDEIISRFRQQLGEMRSDRSFVKSLEDAVNASTDNLIQNLRTEYKDNFKELDFNILTMMYSGLSIKSIAFYFRMTEPSIRTRKTRYKHLFEESGSPLSGKYIGLMD